MHSQFEPNCLLKKVKKSIIFSLLKNLLRLQYCLLCVLSVILYYSKIHSELIPGKSHEKIRARKSEILVCGIGGKIESKQLNSSASALNSPKDLEKIP